MMDSILNIGVNDLVIRRIRDQTMNPRFAYDVQKRFLQMFGTVVRKVAKEDFLKVTIEAKARDGVSTDSELSTEALQHIVQEFKKLVDVPDDPFEQLKVAVEAIFGSWLEWRAKKYRELHHISEGLGTAIVVQSMVFGNLSSDSCVGKICTRNPDTGANSIYGEYSCCVEGDDISDSLDEKANNIEELQLYLPNVYSELKRTAGVIENFFGDSQV
jgi:pyruvate, orthophosphate dikinase